MLVHGSPSDHRGWLPFVGHAPADARLVLVDLLDHGGAPDDESPGCVSIESDLRAIVEATEGPVTLVGHSAGAYLAARLLASLGDRVSRAVLIAGFPGLPPQVAVERAGLWQSIERGELSRAAFEDAVITGWLGREKPNTAALPLMRSILTDLTQPRLKRYFQRIALLGTDEARVPPFDTPALVIHSQRDPTLPHELGVELARLGRRAELVTRDDDCHWLDDDHARAAFGAER